MGNFFTLLQSIMKSVVIVLATLAISASAFAPPSIRQTTQTTELNGFFDKKPAAEAVATKKKPSGLGKKPLKKAAVKTPVEKKPLFSFGKAASSPKTFNKKVVAKKAPVKKTFGKKSATPAAAVKKPGFFAKKAAAPAKTVAAKKTIAKKAAPKKALPAKKVNAKFFAKPKPAAKKVVAKKAAPTKKDAKKEDGFQLRLPTFRFGKDKKTVASAVFDMDLYNFRTEKRNDYGGRKTKNLKVGTLTANSYVPNGMTQREYTKMRFDEKAKKDANYQRNVKKAGIFTDYTDFYLKRGTDVKDDWYGVTNGHDMAKTKYDWSGGASGTLKTKQFATEAKSKVKGKK